MFGVCSIRKESNRCHAVQMHRSAPVEKSTRLPSWTYSAMLAYSLMLI